MVQENLNYVPKPSAKVSASIDNDLNDEFHIDITFHMNVYTYILYIFKITLMPY